MRILTKRNLISQQYTEISNPLEEDRETRNNIHKVEENHTWNLVDLSKGKKAVGCKWYFGVTVNQYTSMSILKARLVAKRYAKTYGWVI